MKNRIIIKEFEDRGFTGRVDFDQELITISGNGVDAIEVPLSQYDDFAEFIADLKCEKECL